MARARALLLPLLCLLLPGIAHADSAAADAALQHGVELRKEGKDDLALAEFQRAYELSPSPRARAQIGLAELALGRWLEAEKDLKEALAARDEPWIARNQDALTKSLDLVAPHLGWLLVDANVTDGELLVNGARVAHLPMSEAVRVVAGTSVIEVHAKGFVDIKRPVEVPPTAKIRETVQLVPEGAGPATSSTVVIGAGSARVGDTVVYGSGGHDGRPTLRAIGLVTAGLGLGAIGVGTYFGIHTLSLKSQRDTHCSSAGCDPTGLSLDRDARTSASLSDVTLVVGIPVALLGAFLFYRGATAPPPSALEVRLVPRVGQHGIGIGAEGAW